MDRERLTTLMQAHQKAIEAGHEPLLGHKAMLSVLRGLAQGDFTGGQAIRLLRYQALMAQTPPMRPSTAWQQRPSSRCSE